MGPLFRRVWSSNKNHSSWWEWRHIFIQKSEKTYRPYHSAVDYLEKWKISHKIFKKTAKILLPWDSWNFIFFRFQNPKFYLFLWVSALPAAPYNTISQNYSHRIYSKIPKLFKPNVWFKHFSKNMDRFKKQKFLFIFENIKNFEEKYWLKMHLFGDIYSTVCIVVTRHTKPHFEFPSQASSFQSIDGTA